VTQRRHLTAGVDPTVYADFKVGQRVMTVDGYPGIVTAVEDGGYPGQEQYQVTLDDGMGGGAYGPSDLSSYEGSSTAAGPTEAYIPTEAATAGVGLTTADQDYPNLHDVLRERLPLPHSVRAAALRTQAVPSLYEIGADAQDAEGIKGAWVRDLKGRFLDEYPGGTYGDLLALWDQMQNDPFGIGSLVDAVDDQIVLEVADDLNLVAARQTEAGRKIAGWVIVDDIGEIHFGPVENRYSADDALAELRTQAPGAGLYVQRWDSPHDTMTLTPVGIRSRTAGWFDDTMNRVTEEIDERLPESIQERPGNNRSRDWCRFRVNQRCMFPKNIDIAATQRKGYAVWIPVDRGFCPRQDWALQEACPISEPGPNSGVPGAAEQIDRISSRTAEVVYLSVTCDGCGQTVNAAGEGHMEGCPYTGMGAEQLQSPGHVAPESFDLIDVFSSRHEGYGMPTPWPIPHIQQGVDWIKSHLGDDEEDDEEGTTASKVGFDDFHTKQWDRQPKPRAKYPKLVEQWPVYRDPARARDDRPGSGPRADQWDPTGMFGDVDTQWSSTSGGALLEADHYSRMPPLFGPNSTPHKDHFSDDQDYYQWYADQPGYAHGDMQPGADGWAKMGDDSWYHPRIPRHHVKRLPSGKYEWSWGTDDGGFVGVANSLEEAKRIVEDGGKSGRPPGVTKVINFNAARFHAIRQMGKSLEAGWVEVRDKATQMRSQGRVRIISVNEPWVTAEVQGDGGVYQTTIMRQPGTQAVAVWECGCPWDDYSWGRSGRWKKYEGRMCSHALALMYEVQAQGPNLSEQANSPWPDQDVRRATRRSRVGGVIDKTALLVAVAERILAAVSADASVEEIVDYVNNLARTEEPRVSNDMRRIVERYGGELEGFQYRLKDPSSIERKLKTKYAPMGLSGQDLAYAIKDVLRFTMAFPEADWGHSVQKALWALEEAGYRITAESNTWARGDAYSDLKYEFLTPSGLPIEIQFHTSASFRLKQEKVHSLYDEFRDPSTPLNRKQQLYDDMAKMWEDIDIPDNALDFPGLRMYPRPASRRVLGFPVKYRENVLDAQCFGDMVQLSNGAAVPPGEVLYPTYHPTMGLTASRTAAAPEGYSDAADWDDWFTNKPTNQQFLDKANEQVHVPPPRPPRAPIPMDDEDGMFGSGQHWPSSHMQTSFAGDNEDDDYYHWRDQYLSPGVRDMHMPGYGDDWKDVPGLPFAAQRAEAYTGWDQEYDLEALSGEWYVQVGSAGEEGSVIGPFDCEESADRYVAQQESQGAEARAYTAARDEGPEAMLNDEPEPALPATDGTSEIFDSESGIAPLDQVVPDDDLGGIFDHTMAAANPLPTDGDIAAQARRFLAAKVFSPGEQAALINEDGRAANLDRLEIEGTHYEHLPESDEELEALFF
jgi:hypothetical protein